MRDEIQVAARWWADQLRGPVRQDHGHDPQAEFNAALTEMAASRLPPVTPEQINTFEAALVDVLDRELAEYWPPPDKPSHWGSLFRTVGVDYHPEPWLWEALEKAGIGCPSLRLPHKTVMWIDPGVVKVAVGYGAPIRVLWQAAKEASDESHQPA